ncbi:MAG: helix-turn-helix transcriptional regulator [Lachnospiraceae bacterium]|nr:helix-turn-helix transcriptional regulator [Candidatus Merdinaster equi]
MFEDILRTKKMNIAQLSKSSGVGYNYIFKIVNNQTDFDRCGIKTAKSIADALGMDLNEIYKYKEEYFENQIYYQDQADWNIEMFGLLNAELNKLFLIGIDYHFTPGQLSRNIDTCKVFDKEIKRIKYNRLSERTKCIMVAILNQQKKLSDFIKVYPNLSPLVNQSPLDEKLFLSENPYDIFPSYREMNIAY